jgi:hypothetical protein
MPTVTEIKNPKLGYCKDRDTHCLCLKCPAKNNPNCPHTCKTCINSAKIIECIESNKCPKEIKNMANKPQNALKMNFFRLQSKPITECEILEGKK